MYYYGCQRHLSEDSELVSKDVNFVVIDFYSPAIGFNMYVVPVGLSVIDFVGLDLGHLIFIVNGCEKV